MAKMGKYGLGFKWAPEFPWMLPNASEKLGYPERSEEDGFCPSAAQEPKVKGKTLVNHVRVDCSRLPALECCVQSAIIRDIFVDEDPQKVEASTMMALQFGSAVLVKPSKRLSIQAWANLGVLPKTAAMGLFKRLCLCNTRECVCDAHVAFQLFTVQPDGVCLGNGRFIGWFVPVTAIPEYAKQWLQPWSILLRKGGNKGSVTSGHFRRAVTMPVYDFNVEDACEEVHLNPKGKYSCKAYALLKGYRGVKPILFVDQYGCDYTGVLAKGLEDYGDLTLSEMKELFPVWCDSLDNEVVVAWHVDKPKVREIPSTQKIKIIFALDATFDSVLSKACSEFEVDKDVTLDELLDVVLDAVESTLSPCREHDVIGTKVCALFDRLAEDYVYLFDEGGDEVIAPRMYCSFSAPDDEDCVAADVVYADENQDDDADDSVVLVADTQAKDGVAKEQVEAASELCVAHTGSQEELTEPDAVESQTPIASAEETEVGEASDREGIAEAKATVCADVVDACPAQVEAFEIDKVEDSILDELQTELNAPADKTYEDVLAFDAIYSEALSVFYAVPSDETHFKVCGFYSPAIERTNCWLRSTLIVMQSLPLEFKDLEMQKLWLSYKAGYDQCFVDKLVKSVPKSIILPQGGYVNF